MTIMEKLEEGLVYRPNKLSVLVPLEWRCDDRLWFVSDQPGWRYWKICDALRDLVPFVRFKKREKHPWRSVTFSKVAGFSLKGVVRTVSKRPINLD